MSSRRARGWRFGGRGSAPFSASRSAPQSRGSCTRLTISPNLPTDCATQPYFLAPNVKQRFLATLPGAILAVGCWIALSYLLGLYFRHFANFNKTYGTLGAAIAL